LTLTASASLAQQKTVRACDAEWRANKATLQNEGKKKKDFMIQCRLGQAAASPAIPAPDATNQNRTARDTTAPAQSPRRGTTISTGAGEFATEQEAKAHCPGETVVWANTRSKVYHFPGSRSYANTKRGAYMCERDTASAGIRSAKNEKRPQ
jgi:hypothetical protein